MTTTVPTCPTCSGPQMVGHPCGWATFQHTTDCSIRAAEDGRKVADDDQLDHGAALPADSAGQAVYMHATRLTGVRSALVREATDAERTLLNAAGATRIDGRPMAGPLWTVCTHVAGRVRRRVWPELVVTGGENNE